MDVLVDLDGTLVDPKPGLIGSIQYALGKLGVPVPPADDLLWMIGPPFRVSFPKLLGRSDLTEDAIAHYRECYFSGGMYDAVVYDGVPAALDALCAAGCRLFIATAKPHYYARPILERFGLAPRFAGIYGPELDGTLSGQVPVWNEITREWSAATLQISGDVFTPEMFGGNVHAAFAAAQAVNGTLFIPAGTYDLGDSPLVMTRPVNVVGTGENSRLDFSGSAAIVGQFGANLGTGSILSKFQVRGTNASGQSGSPASFSGR